MTRGFRLTWSAQSQCRNRLAYSIISKWLCKVSMTVSRVIPVGKGVIVVKTVRFDILQCVVMDVDAAESCCWKGL